MSSGGNATGGTTHGGEIGAHAGETIQNGGAAGQEQTNAGGTVASAGSGSEVSFVEQIQPILSESCALIGCHAGVEPMANMNLSDGYAYDALVNVASLTCASRLRVVPGVVDQSYVVNKLLGQDLCSGVRMPKDEEPLPDSELALIQAWIGQGAPRQ